MQSKFQILFSPFLVTVKTFANCLYSHDPPSFCWESPSEAAESSLFEVSSSLLTEQLVEAPWAKGGRCVPFYCDIWTAFVMGFKKINNIHMDLLHPFIFFFLFEQGDLIPAIIFFAQRVVRPQKLVCQIPGSWSATHVMWHQESTAQQLKWHSSDWMQSLYIGTIYLDFHFCQWEEID